MNDIDVLRQMYATLCGGIDNALTLLEQSNVWEAKKVLQAALFRAEELYVAGEQAPDELSKYRNKNEKS